MAIQDPQQRTTARRVEYRDDDRAFAHDDRRAWPKWPLWLALGLFGLACLAAGLISAGNDDTSAKRQGNTNQSQSASGGNGQGSLTAAGAGILPGQGGRLRSHVGQSADGRNLIVQSVSGKSGFVAGTGQQDRVYVEWSSAVGENEANFVPKAGDHINLTGPVRPAPANPARTLKLQPQDAEIVRSQGAFVNADNVSRAG